MIPVLVLAMLVGCSGDLYYEQFDPDDVVEGCTYLEQWVDWTCSNPDCRDHYTYDDCYQDLYSIVEHCEENGTYCVTASEAEECELWMVEHPSVDACEEFPNECAQGRLQVTCES